MFILTNKFRVQTAQFDARLVGRELSVNLGSTNVSAVCETLAWMYLIEYTCLQLGLPGDVRPVGEGVSELRLDYGPGYRVYFIRRGQECLVLLAEPTHVH